MSMFLAMLKGPQGLLQPKVPDVLLTPDTLPSGDKSPERVMSPDTEEEDRVETPQQAPAESRAGVEQPGGHVDSFAVSNKTLTPGPPHGIGLRRGRPQNGADAHNMMRAVSMPSAPVRHAVKGAKMWQGGAAAARRPSVEHKAHPPSGGRESPPRPRQHFARLGAVPQHPSRPNGSASPARRRFGREGIGVSREPSTASHDSGGAGRVSSHDSNAAAQRSSSGESIATAPKRAGSTGLAAPGAGAPPADEHAADAQARPSSKPASPIRVSRDAIAGAASPGKRLAPEGRYQARNSPGASRDNRMVRAGSIDVSGQQRHVLSAAPPLAEVGFRRRHSVASPMRPRGAGTAKEDAPPRSAAQEPEFVPPFGRLSRSNSRDSQDSSREAGRVVLPPIGLDGASGSRPGTGRSASSGGSRPASRRSSGGEKVEGSPLRQAVGRTSVAAAGEIWMRSSSFARSDCVLDAARAAAMAAMNHTDFKVSQYAPSRAPSIDMGGAAARRGSWFSELSSHDAGGPTRSASVAPQLAPLCPTHEGMLKVETFGEQRVRNLLYKQSVWVPAYSLLKDGLLQCSKDRKHTKVVDAFNMLETTVDISPDEPSHLELRCHTDHGDSIVELRAKNAQDALEWVRMCNLSRRWAQMDQRTKLGLAPLSGQALRLVGLRKLQKRRLAQLLQACMDLWSDEVCDRQEREAAARPPPPEPKPQPKPKPQVHERTVTAVVPGQVRKLKVVDGKVSVGGAVSEQEQAARDRAMERRAAAAAERVRQVQASADEAKEQQAQIVADKKALGRVRRLASVDSGAVRKSTESLQGELMDMLYRFEKVNQGMGKVLEKVGM